MPSRTKHERKLVARAAGLAAAISGLLLTNPAEAGRWYSHTGEVEILGDEPCAVATEQAKAVYGSMARFFKNCEVKGDTATAYWYANEDLTVLRPGLALYECGPGEIRFLQTCRATPPVWVTRKECWGNPVDVLTGFKEETYEDYATAGPDPLAFRRVHVKNGGLLFRAGFQDRLGRGWRSNYDANLYVYASSRVVTVPDGEELVFAADNGTFRPAWIEWRTGSFAVNPGRAGVAHSLALIEGNYELTTPAGEILVFAPRPSSTTNYRLDRIRRRGGLVETLAYDDPGDPARNTGVIDNRGRSLTFEYDGFGRMVRLTAGGVPVADYAYLGRVDTAALEARYTDTDFTGLKLGLAVLEKVSFPPAAGATLTYHYEDATSPFGLTGITDERGVRAATFTYDTLGRATVTRHADGADRTELAYDPAGNRVTITNPLGKTAIVEYTTTSQGNRLATAIRGQPSPNCAAADTLTEYGTNDFASKVTDAEGRVTTTETDTVGLPTRIVRGFGTPEAATTTIAWNTKWRVPSRIVEPGLTTDFDWDSVGRLQSVTRTDTTTHNVPYATAGQVRTWTYAYTSSGLLTSTNGPLPGAADIIAYTYNGQGFLQTITNEVGHVTTVTAWSERGQPLSITDPNGSITAYGYDGRGRLLTITQEPGTGQTRWSINYDAAGNVRQVTEPTGAQLNLTWDGARRLTRIENNLGERVAFTRDAMGGATRTVVTSSAGTVVSDTARVFDELGRLIRLVGGEARTWRWAYDRTDLGVSATDPRGGTMTNAFDALARLRSETERDGGILARQRDGKDDVTAVTDPRGLSTTLVRNGFGDVIQEASPDRGTTVLEVDPRGLLTRRTDARGVVTTFAYDAAGRLTTRAYPGSPAEDVAITWDQTGGGNKGKGRITRMVDQSGTTAWTWDSRGRLVREVRTVGSVAHTTAYTWDAAGRLTQTTYPSGRVVAFGYDALGRPRTVNTRKTASDPAVTVAAAADYLAFGPLRNLEFGNGLAWRSNFDLETRPKQIRVEPTAGGAALLQRRYVMGTGDQITAIDDELGTADDESFAYDPVGRLMAATGPYGSLAWTYDLIGNRRSETIGTGPGATVHTYVYPGTSNRLTSVKQGATVLRSFTHTASGEQRSETEGGVVTDTVPSDAGQLSRLDVAGTVRARYTYDGLGRLALRSLVGGTPSGDTHYLHDRDNRIIAETNGAGTTVREYLWLGDMPVAVVEGADTASPNLRTVHTDHLARPVMMTNLNGAIVWRAKWKPFGEVHSITGAAAFDLRFPGQWFQLESGLHYNWHRTYDPSTGRYLQPDPLGLDAVLRDGPSLYGYARQSPLRYTDPEGRLTSLPNALGILSHWWNNRRDQSACPAGGPLPQTPLLSQPDRDCDNLYYYVDIPTCRAIERKRGKAAAQRCYASATHRLAACRRGEPLPPLDTWNN